LLSEQIIPLHDFPLYGIRHLGNLKTFNGSGKKRKPIDVLYEELLQAKRKKQALALAEP